jgi:arylsulfatase A-like enzyme
VLARHGYVTAGISGNLFYGSRDFGLARGFGWYDNAPPASISKLMTTWSFTRRVQAGWRLRRGEHQSVVRRPGSHVTSALLRWIDRRGSRPFFASVNYFDAHEPYLAPAPFNRAFSASQPRYWLEGQPRNDPTLLRELEIAYESCIRYVDHEFARLLDALRARGILDNTVVIVVSDHGEQFGQYHGTHLLGHDRSLYASVLRVPLVLWYPPRVPAGVRQQAVVSIRDVPVTVLDVLNLPNDVPFPGTSLLRYATGTVTDTEVRTPRLARLEANRFYTAEMDWAQRTQHRFSLAVDSLHYLVDASGNEALYDFVSDPREQRNLIDEPALFPDLQRFRAVLDSVVPDSMQVLRQISAR